VVARPLLRIRAQANGASLPPQPPRTDGYY
jgi:hypothetical protein